MGDVNNGKGLGERAHQVSYMVELSQNLSRSKIE